MNDTVFVTILGLVFAGLVLLLWQAGKRRNK